MSVENTVNQRLELFHDAMLIAYPDFDSLEQMVKKMLNVQLQAFAGSCTTAMNDVMFRLFQKAEANGWLEQLIIKAVYDRPTLTVLREKAKSLLKDTWQILVSLVPILRQISEQDDNTFAEKFLDCYKRTCPNTWEEPLIIIDNNTRYSLIDYAVNLAKAPRNGNGASPLINFIDILFKKLDLQQYFYKVNLAIDKLAVDDIDKQRLHAGLLNIQNNNSPATEHVLVLQVTSLITNPGFYSVKAWLYSGEKSVCVSAGEEALRLEEIPELLERLRNDMVMDLNLNLNELFIQFILPFDLLAHGVEQWLVSPGILVPDKVPIGFEHPVVVRLLELMKSPAALNLLRQRWQIVKSDCHCQVKHCLSQNSDNNVAYSFNKDNLNLESIYTYLRQSPQVACCIFEASPQTIESSLQAVIGPLLQAGIPVILWLRNISIIDEPQSRPKLCDLIDGKLLRELPHRVWRLRQEATNQQYKGDQWHMGKHLTLLWEDAERISPDFITNNRLRSP